MALKTDYVNDIFSGKRKYTFSDNSDGTFSIEDVTNYTQQGTVFGAPDINAITTAINRMNATKIVTVTAANWSASAPYTQRVSVSEATNDPDVHPDWWIAGNATADQYEAFTFITSLETLNGAIEFKCLTDKPATDVQIMIKGL